MYCNLLFDALAIVRQKSEYLKVLVFEPYQKGSNLKKKDFLIQIYFSYLNS